MPFGQPHQKTSVTHTATVDWGDGTSGPATVDELAGSGTVTASHTYTLAGTFGIEVCVSDDDGGSACDALQVTVEEPQGVTAMSLQKVDTLVVDSGDGEVNPDDTLRYQVKKFGLE